MSLTSTCPSTQLSLKPLIFVLVDLVLVIDRVQTIIPPGINGTQQYVSSYAFDSGKEIIYYTVKNYQTEGATIYNFDASKFVQLPGSVNIGIATLLSYSFLHWTHSLRACRYRRIGADPLDGRRCRC